ncbi:hypothetical protein F2Q69_00034534 [Brassica cretica]|uniref:Uncharacterized protein n=1 Tax=Brassica cretica TaxID=69181 RepID=A0A8S9SHQ4_BRACR|nr:hypothetical protein F2Q69_00034534 [Brassica cretica]
MDQKTINDRVNALLEEHLKDLGIGKIPENHDNPSPPLSENSLSMASPVVRMHQNSFNSPALVAATPSKGFGPKKKLAKELEKESGADEKKKAAQADVAFKRKEKAEARKQAAEDNKKEAEAKKKVAEAKKKETGLKKKQEAELKKQKQTGSKYKKVTPLRDGVTSCKVQPDVEDSSLADITDEVVAEQNEFALESDVENSEVGNAKGKGNEKKRMKGGVSSEAEPPTKKQKKVKTQNESEADAAGKGSSEKEGSKELELENKATLTTIVSTLDIISRKFDQVDSRLEAYELDQNRPLMDQKTIDDRVNVLLEERLKDLGIGKIPENHDNPSPPLSDNSLLMASPVVRTHQKSVNSPALVAATPGKEFGPKKNLAKELEKESGVKRTLDEEFGSVDKATDMRPLDFIVVSPANATKNDKATKDDKAAKDPAYGHGCRRKCIVKGEEADEKKKAVHAYAAFKRKEKAEAKKKAAEDKKKEAEAKKKEAEGKKKVAEAKKKEAELKKKQEAELKKQKQVGSKLKKVTPPRDSVTRCKVQPDVEDSSLADITDEVVAEQNESAPESDVENSKVHTHP